MNSQAIPTRRESRLLPIAGILVVMVMLELLPGRLRVLPMWFPYVAAIILLIPMLGVALTGAVAFARLERLVIVLFVTFSVIVMALTLERLVDAIAIHKSGYTIGGNLLLASAIAVWVINVIAFALLYWVIDRGGPDLRASNQARPADIQFPVEPQTPYSFITYLFYAYTASTAFSPTEMFPRTPRAQVLMMLQSTISLVTVIIVASRAINTLK